MSNQSPPTEAPEEKASHPNNRDQNRVRLVSAAVILVVVAVLALIIFGLTRDPERTANIRDIMIIFLVFISLLIGVMLVVLAYQMAMLTILLRDEIKPLLESAQETVNTLRGTTVFLSDNLIEPTIKASSSLAGAWRILEVLFNRRPGDKWKS